MWLCCPRFRLKRKTPTREPSIAEPPSLGAVRMHHASINLEALSASMPYPDRLSTFAGYWDQHEETARQLAAIGHVYDRPPLETLEEGTRCVSCGIFVKREDSIRRLAGIVSNNPAQNVKLHHAKCLRLQTRIPGESEPATTLHIDELRLMFEPPQRATDVSRPLQDKLGEVQKSHFFSLPVEIRLEIYKLVLPDLDDITEIVSLNRVSDRIVTAAGQAKIGPRDLTKTNILHTCRMIYDEAMTILFNRRTYLFASTRTMYLFLRNIGPRGRRLLISVDVVCGQREDAIAFAILASCASLQQITIRLNRPRLMIAGAPMWCVEGVATLLDLSGLQSVNFAASGGLPGMYLDEAKPDAGIVRAELTRPRGDPSRIRWVSGYPDI